MADLPMNRTTLSIFLAAQLVLACDSSKSETSKPNSEPKPATTNAPISAVTTAPSATAAPSAAPAAAATGTTATPGAPIFDGAFPDTETKPPSVKEWQTDAKLYIVKHSSGLLCETLALREWIRVSCRGKPGAPNQPTDAKLLKAPKKGQHYLFSRESVASLVIQPRKGQTSEFTFEWTNWGTRTLSVSFPENAEKPVLAFDTAAPSNKGLPLCRDLCSMMYVYHNFESDCKSPCADGYKCEWWNSGPDRTAMCVCATECSHGE